MITYFTPEKIDHLEDNEMSPSNIVIPEEFCLSNPELYKLELEREILMKRARTAVTYEEREMIHNQLLDNESSINILKTDLSE